MTIESQTWSVTMTARKTHIVRDILISRDSSETTSGRIGDAISLKRDQPILEGEDAVGDVTIVPLKIREKKFLGIIPLGKREIEVEFVRDNVIHRARIS